MSIEKIFGDFLKVIAEDMLRDCPACFVWGAVDKAVLGCMAHWHLSPLRTGYAPFHTQAEPRILPVFGNFP